MIYCAWMINKIIFIQQVKPESIWYLEISRITRDWNIEILQESVISSYHQMKAMSHAITFSTRRWIIVLATKIADSAKIGKWILGHISSFEIFISSYKIHAK